MYKIFIQKRNSKNDSHKQYVCLCADFGYQKSVISFDTPIIQDFVGMYGPQYADYVQSMEVNKEYYLTDIVKK